MGFLFNDVLYEDGGGGSAAQEDHYARNAENDAYLKDHGLYDRKDLTVDEIRDAGEFGFKRASDGENIYHRNGPGNENNIGLYQITLIRCYYGLYEEEPIK